MQAVPGAILLVALFFFPESPRWLAGRDRWEEVHEILSHMHANGDAQDPVVLAELEEVREAARISKEAANVTVIGLFGPRMWKRTLAGCSVQVWQQLLGGNVMLYYLVYVNLRLGPFNTSLLSTNPEYCAVNLLVFPLTLSLP